MSIEVRALGFESMAIWATLPLAVDVEVAGVDAAVVGVGGISIVAAGGSE